MKNIEVRVIDYSDDPGGMMMFLAKLTQRGHVIKCMDDLSALLDSSSYPANNTVEKVAALPHGTIKRFCPITVAIVGASRRFLAQARTNQVGFTYVSASLQYSNYGSDADFVVPYALTKADAKAATHMHTLTYLESCKAAMDTYNALASVSDNDTAGYVAPQGLRNILIMQGNHQAWDYFIRTRSCNRNTNETQYVTLRIWEELLKTPYGKQFFKTAGPDCMYGACREGAMCCEKPMRNFVSIYNSMNDVDTSSTSSIPRLIIDTMWPLLKTEEAH